MQLTLPAHLTSQTGPEGLYNLVVTNVDGQSVTLPNAFRVTYPPPAITSITPSSAISNGVVGITDLAGSNFMTGATVKLVKIGESPIATINGPIVQPNKILCFFDLTGQPVGIWDVVVNNPDGQNGTLPGAFTIYYPPVFGCHRDLTRCGSERCKHCNPQHQRNRIRE